MTLVKTSNLKVENIRAEAQFIEGWMSGTYITAGIFAVLVKELTVEDIKSNIPIFHSIAKEAKNGWWPRGLSGMFLFPFYIGTKFDPIVIAWVQKRRPYKWCVWHEPVLYDVVQNAVWMRSDYGLFGSAYYSLVFRLYEQAFKRIAERLQKTVPDFINGKSVT
jgi:hypothetical protein